MSLLPQNKVARRNMLGNMADKIVGFDWRWVSLIGVALLAVSAVMIFIKDKKRENGS
jgi:hypothetical protein